MTDSPNTKNTDQVPQNPPGEPAEQPQAPPAPAASTPTPAPPASTSQAASPTSTSASNVLGKILQTTASVLVGILPAIPAGAVAAGATLAEEGLRAVAEFLISKGSDNALTEAEAEKQLQTLVTSLATIANPLPTPEALEAQGAAGKTT